VLLFCLAVAIAMPYTATLQGAQGGHRTLVIVENMVRFGLDSRAV
jgi:Mrp family chromosome partitioning ATPase